MAAVRFLKSAQSYFQPQWVRIAATLSIAILLANTVQGAEIAWHKKMPDAIRESAKQQKPMLVMIGAQWCGFCHRMQTETFRNSAVATRVTAQFIPVWLDADEQAAFVEAQKIESLPTVLIIAPDRHVLGRFTGFQSATQLDTRLASFKTPAAKPNIVHSLPPSVRAGDTLAAAKQFDSGR